MTSDAVHPAPPGPAEEVTAGLRAFQDAVARGRRRTGSTGSLADALLADRVAEAGSGITAVAMPGESVDFDLDAVFHTPEGRQALRVYDEQMAEVRRAERGGESAAGCPCPHCPGAHTQV